MFFLVCSLSDEQCMLFQNDEVKKCYKCPSSEALEENILQQIENFEQIEKFRKDRTCMPPDYKADFEWDVRLLESRQGSKDNPQEHPLGSTLGRTESGEGSRQALQG